MLKTKTVMAFGTFDILHPGHDNFLREAKRKGDYLVAIIARDKTVKKVKGRLPVNNEKIRKNNILKLKIADKVILGDLKNKYIAIKKFKPDIICLGYDQKFFVNGLKNFNVKIVKLKPYKPEIYKSSIIKKHKTGNIKQEA